MGLASIDLSPPFQIQKEILLTQEGISISTDLLPKQYVDGSIRVGTDLRCKIFYGTLQRRGGYGSIYRAERDSGSTKKSICVKIPHTPTFSLTSEGIIQWLAGETLKRNGILGAVPHIYDIYQYAGETRIAMEFIEGMSSLDWIMKSATPEKTLLQVISQVSLLLSLLEGTMHLDHRDLKGDNVWIRPTPVHYVVSIGGKSWTLAAPFQVVILDFGFSCIGAEGTAIVSLSDGILPRIDPCPKEGRDLFQFIASLWSFPFLRTKISAGVQADVEVLLSYRNKPYANLVKKTIETAWVYLLVSDSEFSHPPLHPLSLLRALSIKYEGLLTSSE